MGIPPEQTEMKYKISPINKRNRQHSTYAYHKYIVALSGQQESADKITDPDYSCIFHSDITITTFTI